jgi:hypothetical protein
MYPLSNPATLSLSHYDDILPDSNDKRKPAINSDHSLLVLDNIHRWLDHCQKSSRYVDPNFS